MDDQRDERRVRLIVYHVVWTPKRRKAVLVGPVAEDCRTLIERTCEERGRTILQRAIQPDHIHLFVRVWPEASAAFVVKACKGLASRELRARHPDLKRRLPSLWTRSRFAATAGDVGQETIQKCIAAQKGL